MATRQAIERCMCCEKRRKAFYTSYRAFNEDFTWIMCRACAKANHVWDSAKPVLYEWHDAPAET